MNDVQTEIQAAQARLDRAQEAQDERQRAERQAEKDRATIVQERERIRQLRIQEDVAEFKATLGENEGLIARHNNIINQLYAALDKYDLAAAIGVYDQLIASFEAQQQWKLRAVSILQGEFAEAARQNPSDHDHDLRVAPPDFLAWQRRMTQVQNALLPFAAVAAHIASKTGIERQRAVGLGWALVGLELNPQPTYSAQAETDQYIRGGFRR